MIYDAHVHVAELHRGATTDRFLAGRPNFYVRAFLKQIDLPVGILRDGQANQMIRQRLLDDVSRSRIDRFVLLAMDRVYNTDGLPNDAQTPWISENDFVAGLAGESTRLLFGASVHPYRPDALQELQRAIGMGACLVKWIPSAQQIRLDDPRCEPFYDLLAAHGVPLLVHTGIEHVSSRGRNDWNDPVLLRYPLRRKVKVIAAHCGARMFLHERCYFAEFSRTVDEFEHLYGDISAFGIPTRIGILRRLQRSHLLMSRIIYGSDFPAFVMPRWFLFSIGLSGVREVLRETNPLDRPFLLMKRMGLPDEVFSRAGSVLRLAANDRNVP